MFLLNSSEAAPVSSEQLQKDIDAANGKFHADLVRFWLGIESPDRKLLWHLVAWEADFAKTVPPEIIDAIMGDLRHEKTVYPGLRANAGISVRQNTYEGVVDCLDRRRAKQILLKWKDSKEFNDWLWADAFLDTLRNREVARQPDGSIYFQSRSFFGRLSF